MNFLYIYFLLLKFLYWGYLEETSNMVSEISCSPLHILGNFTLIYPFHIKLKKWNEGRFDNNAPNPHYLTLKSEKLQKGLLLHFFGGVFRKHMLAKRRSLRQCGCQCERVHLYTKAIKMRCESKAKCTKSVVTAQQISLLWKGY